jgi:hypothetical protein
VGDPKYPGGKLHEGDEGEVGMVITQRHGRVVVMFQQELKWIAMDPGAARQMAAGLLHYAAELEGTIKSPGSNAVN